MTAAGRPLRVVLTAVGSLGDLHPYIAIALGLKARGHEAIVATSECYRQKVEALGLGYRVLRPVSTSVTDPDFMPYFMHPRWGTIRYIREYLLPLLRESFEDTLAAAKSADLLVSHSIAYSARLVAETTGVSWVSTIITPTGLWSAFDPPLMPGFPGVSRALRPLGPMFWGPVGTTLKWATRPMAAPWYRLRKELGLPPWSGNPLVDSHSPSLVLALFSEVLAAKQTDWVPQTLVTGFPFFDQNGEAGLPSDLEGILVRGTPPIVFTVGFAAVTVAGRFFENSIAAAAALGRRAVFVGKRIGAEPVALPEGVFLCEYAPFSLLFPRAVVVVHAGGIGSTGLAMWAGRPMLVVPFAHDQFDNAERLRRLGIARTIPGRRYTVSRAITELRHLLDDPSYPQRASEVGERLGQENGVRVACDALETLLRDRPRNPHTEVTKADQPDCPGSPGA
jgi:UDP:flavonoid glycosyltransferase YjiC (YdhE family)